MADMVKPSWRLLAASGGDTVKLFDVLAESGDPCILSYTPTPGCVVNSVKWNHTNLVVASAGEDKKISLWRKNGQIVGTIPVIGMDGSDTLEESILAINFSNKGSRYMCSGGTSQVVRIWDLQRKRWIKRLKGHTKTITCAAYNCKDEHLASISVGGDIIVHNLASGARATELKDPTEQVLRVLDYSRSSRHLLVTSGDDGNVHLWDTTGRSPKVSWLKQHSAPAAGIGFSPSNDKIIASVGLDKKLYTYDTGSRRPSSCVAYDAPLSTLAFGDNGFILAAGTSNGRVVFYDVRGKPQPYTVLHAFSSSEAVTSLSWQTSKPVMVNENTSNADMALLGGSIEESILMPDPLPSMTSSSISQSTMVTGSRVGGRELAGGVTGSLSSSLNLSSADDTKSQNHLWPGGTLSRLQATRASYNFKDDMEVFSPLVDVHPITPTLDKLWDDHEMLRGDPLGIDKKPSSFRFLPSNKKFPFADEGTNAHPIFDWKSSSTSRQEDTRSFNLFGSSSTPTPSSKSVDSAITPPEAWGGEKLSDKYNHLHIQSRYGISSSSTMASGSMFSTSRDFSSVLGQMSMSPLANTNMSHENLHTVNSETYSGLSENFSSSSLAAGTKGMVALSGVDSSRFASLNFPRRLSTYAERISTSSSFSDGNIASPKIKKIGAETRDDVPGNLLTRSDTAAETGTHSAINGVNLQPLRMPPSDSQRGGSFTLQLFQRTLEETLDSFQKSIHEDMRNLHIEILRQFHMQEMEMSNVLTSILENQAELMQEIKSLRKENQQLRQML